MKDFEVGTYSANLFPQQGVLALPRPCDVALREDGLTLLGSLPEDCTPLVFFDRGVLDKLRIWQRRVATSCRATRR